MEPFQLKNQEDKALYIDSWQSKFPFLKVGFSLRKGGVSLPPYDQLNMGAHVGDAGEHVSKNRRLLAEEVGFSFSSWTCANQVHGNRVHEVTQKDIGSGRLTHEDAVDQADGLFTREKGVLLTSFYADCVPLYFFDPVEKVAGLAHAGWRGTVADIAGQMVRAWVDGHGSQPDNIHAAIGPCIGSCCYEVDDKVARPIQNLLPESKGRVMVNKGGGKYMLNLKEVNRLLMIKAGISASRIEVSQWCTSCRTDMFFSHRKEGPKTGRMASFIGMKQ